MKRVSEAAFETAIESVLLADGYARVDAKGFDRERARWSRYRLPVHDPSEHIAGHSEHKAGHSEHKPGESAHSVELQAIAEPARTKKRLQPHEMEGVILRLCQGRWLTRNALAELLGRHPDGLRARFLTPLVAHGRLRLRYPDKPNRVDQAYTAGAVERKPRPSLPGRLDPQG